MGVGLIYDCHMLTKAMSTKTVRDGPLWFNELPRGDEPKRLTPF